MREILAWLGVICLLGATDCYAEETNPALANWPHWRGPLANGTAPLANPPVKWDATTNIRWKVDLPGPGNATPIVWGDQVFVLTAVKTDRVAGEEDLPKADPRFEKKTNAPTNFYRFLVQSFDRSSGKLRWQQVATEAVPHEGHHDTHCYAGGSPTTDGHYLYVSFGSFGTYCYDLQGKLQWKVDLGRINSRLGWGEAVTPVIHGDSLLLNLDQEGSSALVCLDPRTGKTRWKTEREEKTSWNTPLVVEHGGKFQVVVNGTNRVRSYDLATGKELWRCGGMTINAIPSPVAADGVVYVMSGYKGSCAVAIPLDAEGDITGTTKPLWQIDKGTPYVSSPVLVKDRLYFIQVMGGQLSIVDTKTGKVLVDRERLPTKGNIYASPLAAGGLVYISDLMGTTVVLKQGDKLEVLAVNRLEEPLAASPVAVGKQLFLRGEKRMYCIEAP
jgi:outer membrane protein assembly factor BamB